MDKNKIIRRIENFAPPETAEPWDCSGWLVKTERVDVNSIMLALTITEDVVNQAKNKNCEMIISHHPLFCVPISYKNIDMYCAHTNMDLASGGTTDSLIEKLSDCGLSINNKITIPESFVRYIETDIELNDLLKILSEISPNLRWSGNINKRIKKIALCAGSGSEFIGEAADCGADCYITGDMKFHTALESPITVIDIGHFESEIQVLDVFKSLIGSDVEIVKAQESSPFKYFS